jgi:RNA polymerase sigma-70 factor (ECF subfamily)
VELLDTTALVSAAQRGDLVAYARLVRATQVMVYAVARRVLRERADALDATQETYLRAFRRLGQLSEPAAFPGFLRRIAIRAAHDLRRARRTTFAPPFELAELPVLDEREEDWSEQQRLALARSLLALTPEERRTTERFYYGRWSLARLAAEQQVSEPAMRKRLQRIRDKLREEIEMGEQRVLGSESLPGDLPDRIVELLARPRLAELPENPVGKLVALLRAHFHEHEWVELPEMLDLPSARSKLAHDPVYVPARNVFHLQGGRILRYDLTLPLVISSAGRGAPLRLITAGKVYRDETETATHLSAFHQLELLELDDKARVDPWRFMARVFAAIDQLLPGAPQRVAPTSYPFCERAWDIGVEVDGEYHELLGCGVYKSDVLRVLGGDPARHAAIGLGLGLDRWASLSYRIPDIRTLSTARV